MSRQSGFSVVELLVAAALVCIVSGMVVGLLHDGLVGTPILEESTDLQQRARVVADVLASELRAAAAGTPSGPLLRYFAAVEPRLPSDAPGTVSAGVITLRYVPRGAARALLAQPLAPGATIAVLDTAGCPAATTACGFTANSTAIVFDTTGNASVLQVETIGPGVLTISEMATGRTASYPVGAEIAEALQVTFSIDASARQLRRTEGGGAFVVADNVTALTFEYFGRDLTPLAPAQLADGPYVGTGSSAFDVDLLSTTAIRATVRLETGVDAMRGADTAVFARPGTAPGPRTIPDVVQRVFVALRNHD